MIEEEARAATSLEVDVSVPERGIELSLQPRPGRITAVIGPNGAGKSTLLGAISGAVPARGSVRSGGQELLRRPLHRRGITYLAQDPLLFSTMDVAANVAYGPRSTGISRTEARERARRLLADVDMTAFADRRPRTLSGGQAQRVAIARALAAEPRIVLLDEPMAALDAAAASRIRSLLARTLAGRTVLLVTHDLTDVLALADDVAVLEAGRVVACGTREQIFARPPTAFAARLTGRVLVTGIWREDAVEIEGGAVRLGGLCDPRPEEGRPACALIDPARVSLRRGDDRGADDETGRAVPIESIDRLGSRLLISAGALAAEVEAARALALGFAPGVDVVLAPDAESTVVYPAPQQVPDPRL